MFSKGSTLIFHLLRVRHKRGKIVYNADSKYWFMAGVQVGLVMRPFKTVVGKMKTV